VNITENNSLKQSIILFRQELQKKANQLKLNTNLQSNSVGNLKDNLFFSQVTNSPISQRVRQRQHQFPTEDPPKEQQKSEQENLIEQLTKDLQLRSDECLKLQEQVQKQTSVIEKYESRWNQLKDEARRRRGASFSQSFEDFKETTDSKLT